MKIKQFGKIEEVDGSLLISNFSFDSECIEDTVIDALKAIVSRFEREIERLEAELPENKYKALSSYVNSNEQLSKLHS